MCVWDMAMSWKHSSWTGIIQSQFPGGLENHQAAVFSSFPPPSSPPSPLRLPCVLPLSLSWLLLFSQHLPLQTASQPRCLHLPWRVLLPCTLCFRVSLCRVLNQMPLPAWGRDGGGWNNQSPKSDGKVESGVAFYLLEQKWSCPSPHCQATLCV